MLITFCYKVPPSGNIIFTNFTKLTVSSDNKREKRPMEKNKIAFETFDNKNVTKFMNIQIKCST